MSRKTDIKLRNLSIYQVYSRNHNKSGTFQEFISDLDRIKDLGFDFVYLLPIHPIGEKNKKGELGCPYAIQDYSKINPEYGTVEDYEMLIKEIHNRDMKIMMDIVYNHTSPDSRLLFEHPDWFYYNDKFELANRVGEWWDVTDFDFSKSKQLWVELIDNLKYWAGKGVDAFRCDVAPLVPIEFWEQARKEVEQVNPNMIWLSESVHVEFVKYIRDCGFEAASDSEIYSVFDMAYDYDVYDYFISYLKREISLKMYLNLINRQEGIYPKNYVKLRYLENHDTQRIASIVSDENILRNLTAFVYFLRGSVLIYAGQEAADSNRPSLFDIDKVNWEFYNQFGLADMIRKCNKLKHDSLFAEGILHIDSLDDVACISYSDYENIIYGIFNFDKKQGKIKVDVSDGTYKNLIDDSNVAVKNGTIEHIKDPIVFKIKKS